ncbi:hypothetical protein O9929_18500 [Vibrio lentus]|nr:hypothetical protein [Vibrio lentus]
MEAAFQRFIKVTDYKSAAEVPREQATSCILATTGAQTKRADPNRRCSAI